MVILFYIERKWLSMRNLGSVSMLEMNRISNKMNKIKNFLRGPNSDTFKEITQHTTR